MAAADQHESGRQEWRDAYTRMSDFELRVREKQLDLNNGQAELQRLKEDLKRCEKELAELQGTRDAAEKAAPLLRLKLIDLESVQSSEAADMHRLVEQLRTVTAKMDAMPMRRDQIKAERAEHLQQQQEHLDRLKKHKARSQPGGATPMMLDDDTATAAATAGDASPLSGHEQDGRLQEGHEEEEGRMLGDHVVEDGVLQLDQEGVGEDDELGAASIGAVDGSGGDDNDAGHDDGAAAPHAGALLDDPMASQHQEEGDMDG